VCVCVCAPCEANWRYFRDRSCLVKAFFFLRASHYLKIAGQLCAPHSLRKIKQRSRHTRPPLFFILSLKCLIACKIILPVCVSQSAAFVQTHVQQCPGKFISNQKVANRPAGALLFFIFWVASLDRAKGEQPEPVRAR
jgi:hypothetical protein